MRPSCARPGSGPRSTSPPRRRWPGFLGARLCAVDEVRSPAGKTTGALLRLDTGVIHVSVEADELIVDVA
jgi:hypothetical protein